MLVQPLDDASFQRSVLELLIRRCADRLLFFADQAAVPAECEHRYEIGVGLADTIDNGGRYCSGPYRLSGKGIRSDRLL